jgi:hypothetical protein
VKWLDDAKDKAQKATDEAKAKAAEEAGKAAVSATLGAVKRGVEGLADSWLSAAEAHLEQQEDATSAPHTLPQPMAEDPDLAEVNAAEAAQAELLRLKESTARVRSEGPALHGVPDTPSAPPALTPPEAATSDIPTDPAPAPVPSAPALQPRPARRADPFAAAHEALEKAARARGVEPQPFVPEPRPDPSDPFATARAALERSRSAREDAKVGRVAREREARAREELDRLKGGDWSAAAPAAPRDDPDQPPAPRTPKKRRL